MGGAISVALTMAVVIGIFAGIGMEVRAAETWTWSGTDASGPVLNAIYFTSWSFPVTMHTGDTMNMENAMATGGAFTYTIVYRANGKEIYTYSCQVGDMDTKTCVLGSAEECKGYTEWKMTPKEGSNFDLYLDAVIDDPAPDPDTTGEQNDSKDTQKDTQKQPVAPHTHSFEWMVTKEPTKTEDGLEEYKCKGCGAVEASQPISANMIRVKELYRLVKDAPKGGTVTYDFGDLSTISDYVLAEMAERNDVTVTVSFIYGGEAHSITFPAGTDYTVVLTDADTMYGFYGVAAKLGLTVE